MCAHLQTRHHRLTLVLTRHCALSFQELDYALLVDGNALRCMLALSEKVSPFLSTVPHNC